MNKDTIKELIILYLGNNGKKYTKKQIIKYVKENIDEELKELELEGLIYLDKNNMISSFPNHLVKGRIKINNNEAILVSNNKRYIIPLTCLNGALNNDYVAIRPMNTYIRNNIGACVEKIIKRDTGRLLVEVVLNNNMLEVEDIKHIINKKILINKHELSEFNIGDRLLIELGKEHEDYYDANIIEYIASKDDPNKDIKAIVINNGFNIGFSEEAIKEANSLPDEVREEDIKGRLDLRNDFIFTIDKATTKDRDDAISVKILDNGNYLLGVHIADVSHYVKPGMKLWDEAMERGTSLYPIDMVIPMLPPKLSDGICSLNPGVDRLTESTFIEIDPMGNIVDYYSKSTVINSRKACTYEDINRILENHEDVEGYEKYKNYLNLLETLMYALRSKMHKNGMLEFNTSDIDVIRDKNGNFIKIVEEKMGTAQKIIEFDMLVTDMVKAEESMLPMVYRIHEAPDIAKINETLNIIRKTVKGIKIPRNITSSRQLQDLIEQIHGIPEEQFITQLLIQSMKRARYSVDNIGHFALGVKGDIQYTSPIRRADDLHNQYYSKLQRSGKKLSNIELKKLYLQTFKLCEHLNKREIAAETIEREAREYAINQILNNKTKEVLDGNITFINNKYVLVKTLGGIEGKLDLNNLFRYDRVSNSYKHKHNNFKLVLGEGIKVVTKKKNNEMVFALKK